MVWVVTELGRESVPTLQKNATLAGLCGHVGFNRVPSLCAGLHATVDTRTGAGTRYRGLEIHTRKLAALYRDVSQDPHTLEIRTTCTAWSARASRLEQPL